MEFSIRKGLIYLVIGSFPVAAQAECLGNGCYSGLGLFVAAIVAAALVFLAAFIYAVVVAYRRKGARRAVWLVLAAIGGLYLLLVGWGSVWL